MVQDSPHDPIPTRKPNDFEGGAFGPKIRDPLIKKSVENLIDLSMVGCVGTAELAVS
jgi:hypothetical protein